MHFRAPSHGGWTGFMQSMGLKPWKDDDAAEGKVILEAFVRDDDDRGGNASQQANSSEQKSK
ncbi:hypothetical protein GQ53DRAFT_742046 [Thozetella sp. PMI_491]|nr:hypothetical protein GQ53DRAFT_742046 [Thozetella sp. PMI_491]